MGHLFVLQLHCHRFNVVFFISSSDITALGAGEFGFKERRKAEELKEAMPSNIEERNDYAVRSLQALDHNINATTQAIDLIGRSHPVNMEEKVMITPLLLLSSKDNLMMNSLLVGVSDITDPRLHRKLWSGFMHARVTKLTWFTLDPLVVVV